MTYPESAEFFFSETEMGAAPVEKFSAYVDVTLGIPQDEPYQYAIPKSIDIRKLSVGQMVAVPLRGRELYGYIVNISDKPITKSVKPVIRLVDEEILLDQRMMTLTKWISEYYACSWGMAIETALPTPFKKGKVTMRQRASTEENDDLVHATPRHKLTDHQNSVYLQLEKLMDQPEGSTALLHGVTGSGKTEIYLQLIEKALASGGGAIVLVPEISLTPQTVQRFQSRFGDVISVIHSRISAGKKLGEWHRLRSGEAKVVVGARSAVFAPVKNLKLIVIDEEHDDSYKQDETPRYETGRVADKIAEIDHCVVLKASATPSLESYYEGSTGASALMQLTERVENRPLPVVEVVNMRKEKAGNKIRMFSIPLENAMREALNQGEQVMLLMNRRGFAPFVKCILCGHLVACAHCQIALVYHFSKNKFLCHVCDKEIPSTRICSSCGKDGIRYLGMGTEKVELEVSRLFPDARVERMDRDATAKKGSHERILQSFRKREIDILLGTQMIAKGHDFPGVSVIGVISADTSLSFPDFRSSEKTFSLLTQVAGRAGRQDIKGKVFIQTLQPEHYAISAAQEHDYLRFYEKEMAFRKELGNPPYKKLIRVIFQGTPEPQVLRCALEYSKSIEPALAGKKMQMLGPAPCVISRKNNAFFWQLYIRTDSVPDTLSILKPAANAVKSKGSVRITLDVNPR